MNENKVMIDTDVMLYAFQILDFETNDGVIKGYKLYYTKPATGDYKDNYLGGKAENCFVKDENYSTLVEKLKLKSFPFKAKIKFELQSVDKPPKPVALII